MDALLIQGDTLRTPELRHEVPLGIPDPFFYAELDGRRVVAISAMEAARVDELGTGLEVRPLEEFGADELRRKGLDVHTYGNELALRIVRGLGIDRATVPRRFPLGVADVLRGDGIELEVDQKLFDDRRRRKSPYELAGIRRSQKAAEAGVAVARDLLRRAEPANGGLAVDGEPLTCELLKERIQAAFVANGAVAEEMIVSHGPQTAIGHHTGEGEIVPGEPIVADLAPRDRESGCFADMTRTFVVGEIPAELADWHALCRRALDEALSAIRPGVQDADVHRATSELFSRHGHPTQLDKEPGVPLEDGFYHALGHGVGLDVHEPPTLGLIATHRLVAGEVLAVEPGLYRRDFGGVRLEDLVLVTDDGCENLTDHPYELAP